MAMDLNTFYMNLRNFLHHETLYTRPLVPSSFRVTSLWGQANQTIMKTLHKCRDDSKPHLTMLALRTSKNSSDTSALELE